MPTANSKTAIHDSDQKNESQNAKQKKEPPAMARMKTAITLKPMVY